MELAADQYNEARMVAGDFGLSLDRVSDDRYEIPGVVVICPSRLIVRSGDRHYQGGDNWTLPGIVRRWCEMHKQHPERFKSVTLEVEDKEQAA